MSYHRLYNTLTRYRTHTSVVGSVIGMISAQYDGIKTDTRLLTSKENMQANAFSYGILGSAIGWGVGYCVPELGIPCALLSICSYTSSYFITVGLNNKKPE